jgi:hypothetical protein
VLRLLGLILAMLVAAPAAAGHVTPEGENLITRHEVGGQSAYVRMYQWPVCPACDSTASGVTLGIGYDLRHNSRDTIRSDWRNHPQLPRLLEAQGLGGQRAIAMARSMRDVITPWPMALENFRTIGVLPYKNRARRAFGPDFDRLSPWAQDALISLVYNRGSSMVGPSRVEMRFIRDVCIPMWKVAEMANGCIARKLREMVRIWAGSKIERGMRNRRNDEANLALFSR